jgi:hypothetical protein
METKVKKDMKIVITIGPNGATRFLGRIAATLSGGRKGLVKGWRDNKPAKRVAAVKKAA